jgi:hypothetical protein
MSEMHRAMSGCHEDKIMRTIEHGIRKEWKFFPRPAEFTELLLRLHPLKEPQPKQWPEPPKRSADEVARVRAMTQEYVKALSGGGIGRLTAEDREKQRQRFIAAQRPGFEARQRASLSRKDQAAGERDE